MKRINKVFNKIVNVLYGNPVEKRNNKMDHVSFESGYDAHGDSDDFPQQTLTSVFPTVEIYKEARKYF